MEDNLHKITTITSSKESMLPKNMYNCREKKRASVICSPDMTDLEEDYWSIM